MAFLNDHSLSALSFEKQKKKKLDLKLQSSISQWRLSSSILVFLYFFLFVPFPSKISATRAIFQGHKQKMLKQRKLKRNVLFTCTFSYVLFRRAIIMLTNRITPKTRNTPYRKWAIVTEVWSVESKVSNSAKPRRDQKRCFIMVHQLNDKIKMLMNNFSENFQDNCLTKRNIVQTIDQRLWLLINSWN